MICYFNFNQVIQYMKLLNRKTSKIYLLLVPLLVVVFGFGIGKINYKFYLPIWLINVFLMVMASWILGLHVLNKKTEKTLLAVGAFFLIVPWILVSTFFWIRTAVEATSANNGIAKSGDRH
jgi:hypothetical protein